jgi:hypothetical protein
MGENKEDAHSRFNQQADEIHEETVRILADPGSWMGDEAPVEICRMAAALL